MTKTKRNAVITGIVILGIVGVLFLIPTLFNSANMAVGEAMEIEWQIQLLEYAERGLTFDKETTTFFYGEYIVRRLVDGATYHRDDAGTVEVSVLRDSNGNITDFIVN